MLKLNQRYISLDIFWAIVKEEVPFLHQETLKEAEIKEDCYRLITKHPEVELYLYERNSSWRKGKYILTNSLIPEFGDNV